MIEKVMSNLKLRTNIQELNKMSPAHFSNKPIQCMEQYLENRGIYLKDGHEELICSVPVDKVIGHSQIYGEMKWGDCLNGEYLKRLDRNLRELENNPEYYLFDYDKSDMCFHQVEDAFFICVGKHRTVVSKFFSHFNAEIFKGRNPLNNVTVLRKIVDYEFMYWKKEIERLQLLHPEINFTLKHKTKSDAVCLTLRSNNGRKFEFYNRNQLDDCIASLKSPSLLSKIQSKDAHKMVSYRYFLKLRFLHVH